MRKITAIPAVVAAALMFSAPAAFAASSLQHNGRAGHEGRAELNAFQGSRISLSDAINTAEQHSHGKAIDVSFELRGGKPVYRVKTVQNGSLWEGTIDANSGQVVGSGRSISRSNLNREDRGELSALQSSKVTLAQAASTAEQQIGGKAMDAGLERRNGTASYDVEVVKNGAVQTVMVDPQSGHISSGPNASRSSQR